MKATASRGPGGRDGFTLPLFEGKALDPIGCDVPWLHDVYVAIPTQDAKHLEAWCRNHGRAWPDVVRLLVKAFVAAPAAFEMALLHEKTA